MKNNLTPAEYWEWRTTIGDLSLAKEKFRTTQLEAKLLQKEAETLHIRTQLFLCTRLESAKAEVAKTLAEYERFKGALEESLGQSLNNKLIDDVTFEIRELPDANNQPPPQGATKE